MLHGARLVVVDPRRTELAGLADVHVRCKPGSNVAVFHALAHVLLREGLVDEEFLRERASGRAELAALLHDYAPDLVSAVCDVPARELLSAARLFGHSRRPAIVYGLGVTEHAHGTDGVRALANLAILRGSVGEPGCCGILPLRGQNNVQGASDMGALPDLLPGYQAVADPAVRDRTARIWRHPVPAEPGRRIPQMFDAAISGRLRALHVIGEDICQSDPDTAHVREALRSCEFVVCHDLFLSRTAQHADVVLPAASFLEKEGTFVNFDRRFQRVRPALNPPGEAIDDFQILHRIAGALGTDLGCPTPSAALDECASIAPLFAGVSHERLDREGPLHWPCRAPGEPGEPMLYLDGFATRSGRAELAAVPYRPPGDATDDEYPMTLVTGRRLEHYNTGSMTRRTPDLRLLPEETLDVHPEDAARLGLSDGAAVRVTSRWGAAVLSARTTRAVRPGEVFAAFHFPEAEINALTSSHTDDVTGCPEFKVTAVDLRPAARPDQQR